MYSNDQRIFWKWTTMKKNVGMTNFRRWIVLHRRFSSLIVLRVMRRQYNHLVNLFQILNGFISGNLLYFIAVFWPLLFILVSFCCYNFTYIGILFVLTFFFHPYVYHNKSVLISYYLIDPFNFIFVFIYYLNIILYRWPAMWIVMNVHNDP